MSETDSFKEELKRIADAERSAREAKESILFKLARELGYLVTPITTPVPAGPVSTVPGLAEPNPWVQDILNTQPSPDAVNMFARPVEPAFDGSFAGLIQCYRQHEKSTYHQLKTKVRQNYDYMFNRIIKDVGSEWIANWNAERVQLMYDTNWAADGKSAMGHSIIAKLRTLSTFGSVVLDDNACTRLSAILGNMRFTIPTGKNGDVLTIDHVRAIRSTAHTMFNWPSIALAQAFLLEIPKLKQVDVIGEWVPIGDPGTSDIISGNEKWMQGLRWSDIDENFILRRTITSGRKNQQKLIEVRLTSRPMIMEEIHRVPTEKRRGPVIVCERTNLPWIASDFRRKWRIVADKAGVPDTVTSTSGAYFVKSSKSEAREDEAL